jgi:hypothetical protein
MKKGKILEFVEPGWGGARCGEYLDDGDDKEDDDNGDDHARDDAPTCHSMGMNRGKRINRKIFFSSNTLPYQIFLFWLARENGRRSGVPDEKVVPSEEPQQPAEGLGGRTA